MTKRIELTGKAQIDGYRDILRQSAERTQLQLSELTGNADPLGVLHRMKFQPLGHDPLNPERKLNLIEQLNQTFTYLASFNAAEILFERHPILGGLTLNLGTKSGWDIESKDGGGVIAEVFAAVMPENNQKLAKDAKRVASAQAKHRYVFFMSPGYKPGQFSYPRCPEGVVVWSLGCDP